MLTNADLEDVYFAGLFDGEGWFQIDRSQRKDCKRPSYQVHARLAMKTKAVILELKERYGGSVRKMKSRSDKHAEYFSWDVCGEGALAFAQTMEPFLKIKRNQAHVTIDFQIYKKTNKNGPISDERFEKLTKMYDLMKSLNVRGAAKAS